MWVCVAVNICSYFCEFNTMYHCIIVTFIKQTINTLTFLTDTPSLSLSSLPVLLVLSLCGEHSAARLCTAVCDVVHWVGSVNWATSRSDGLPQPKTLRCHRLPLRSDQAFCGHHQKNPQREYVLKTPATHRARATGPVPVVLQRCWAGRAGGTVQGVSEGDSKTADGTWTGKTPCLPSH